MSEAGGFWARRKAAVEAEEAAERKALEAEAQAAEQAAFEDQSDEEILAALELPEPETLGAGDDFTAFMQKAVPDRIRRRALRVLWRSNPVLANVDMLVDYGEDFTDSAMVIENMQTAYQVGKGMLKHVQEMARQAEEKAAQDGLDPEHALPEEDELLAYDESRIGDAPEDVTSKEEPDVIDHARDERDEPAAQEEHLPAPAAPRRMKFRVEETA